MTTEMTTGWKDLLGTISTKGDIATVLIAGTVGYILDAGLNVIGFLEPGVVGILSASGALGVKKSIEAAWEKRKIERNKQKALEEQKKRAMKLLRLLEGEGQSDLAARLRREINLIETGVVEPHISSFAIDEIIREYRFKPSSATG